MSNHADKPDVRAEFFHPYFRWLDYERDFGTAEEAIDWLKTKYSPYVRHRVRLVTDAGSLVVWTDSSSPTATR